MDKTVGVLGGGQLGRMFTDAANDLNIKVITLDVGNSPAKQVNASTQHIDGKFSDATAIRELADKADILTMEIEHVDTYALEEAVAASQNVQVQPNWRTVRIIQDKYEQKMFLEKRGVATARSVPVSPNLEEIREAVEGELGAWPVMLKTRRDAYDGRGNFPLKTSKDIGRGLKELKGAKELYVEAWADFKMELAVMVVKVVDGADEAWQDATLAFPVVETVHEDSICKLVFAPARGVGKEVLKRSTELARKAVAGFEGRGVFGVEMFLLKNDELLVNEIAPRPHNSGHYTIEACAVSQYQAHLRAILELPLTEEHLQADRTSVMLNILGGAKGDSHLEVAKRALSIPGATVHLYGKGDGRPKRKMGHVTVTAANMRLAEERIAPLIALVDAIRAETLGEKAYTSATEARNPASSEPRPLAAHEKPTVAVIMGSDSDLPVMKLGIDLLEELQIPHLVTITSAHRTPDRMFEFAETAASKGFKVIIAGAGGAAHLPGMVAAKTALPVVGVPVRGSVLDGMDSLLSIVQMPKGCPVATVAINNSPNAAQIAARILAIEDDGIRERLERYLTNQTETVVKKAERLEEIGPNRYTEEMKAGK